jgi:citrate lyase subunit beta/citryl-CoA lyase
MHGFDGASCVHPALVPILNAAFSPSPDDIAWASRVVDAAGSNDGAFALDGRMIDRPVVERARAILRQAR